MWNTLLPYLLGAASAFVAQYLVQFYVVPRTDTRARREERWEKDVLDLGELLSTSIGGLAGKAYAAQWVFQMTSSGQLATDLAGERLDSHLADLRRDAREATGKYTDLVHVRSTWLARRVEDFQPESDAIAEFAYAWRRYQLQTLNIEATKYGEVSESAFDAYWKDERERRSDLLSQVNALARLRHPPRASRRRQIRSARRSITAKVKRKRPELAAGSVSVPPASQAGEGSDN